MECEGKKEEGRKQGEGRWWAEKERGQQRGRRKKEQDEEGRVKKKRKEAAMQSWICSYNPRNNPGKWAQ